MNDSHSVNLMGVVLVVLIELFLGAAPAVAAPLRSCPAGVPVATFDLTVHADGQASSLPLRSVNLLRAGQRITYQPIGSRFTKNKRARIAVIVVPDGTDSSARILTAQPARSPQEWRVPVRAAAIGLVLGPDGIDEKKLSALLEHDPAVVERLAEYAEQHTKVEALIQALASYEQSAPGAGTLRSALKGFSSQYGVDLPTLDRTKPTDEQAAALLRAITPAFAAATPTGTLAQQSGGLAASVASLFFGAPVGLAVGGVALAGNLHASLFPPADFQSAFTQPDDANHLTLCTDSEKRPAKTRIEFVWMTRVPNADAPSVSLDGRPRIPAGWRSTVAVRCATVAQLKTVPRAREWRLTSGSTSVAVPVQIESSNDGDTLTIDLTRVHVPPGDYGLEAMWDWSRITMAGRVAVRSFSTLAAVSVPPSSRDQLIAGSGIKTIELTGADFEFVKHITLAPVDHSVAAVDLPFRLTPQDAEAPDARVTVDVGSLHAGAYELKLTQLNGASQRVPVTVHAPLPVLASLPVRANLGEAAQTVRLHGTRLESIDHITSPDATWTLAPAVGHDITERDAQVQLGPHAQRGEHLSLSLFVTGLTAAVDVANAAVVLDPRPKIREVDVSFAAQPDVQLRSGELPAGVPSGFAIRGEGLGAHPIVQLACHDESAGLTLKSGQRTETASLDRTGHDTLFVSIDPGAVGAPGCELDMVLTDAATGSSDPYRLGRTVRLPHIESFALSEEQASGSLYAGTLRGESLELIERVGWTPDAGWPVIGIATPVAGAPRTEMLRVALPWPSPSPHAPLFIWLRDEQSARRTSARY